MVANSSLKSKMLLAGAALLAACGSNSGPTAFRASVSSPRPDTPLVSQGLIHGMSSIAEDSVTSASTTLPPVTQPESPATTIAPAPSTTQPILCDRYGHPLHHLSCEQADAEYELQLSRERASTSTPTSTSPARGTPTETETAPSTETAPTGSIASQVPNEKDTLVGCIAYYESTWGQADSNVFQFVNSTWRAYGGTGDPANASWARQLEIFWVAWNDSGEHHWAAQAGRCF